MNVILWSVVLVAFIVALTSGGTIVRYFARGVAAAIALAAAAAAVGLIAIGQKAHWTSDGPGMLLIMLGIPICGIVAWFFGILACTTMTSLEEPHLNGPSRVRSLVQAWERYKELTKRPH